VQRYENFVDNQLEQIDDKSERADRHRQVI
jgi:hypothetical protein